MKNGILIASALGFIFLLAQNNVATAYTLERRSKEANSTVYTVKCSDNKTIWLRNENSGRWCSGMTCYGSLDALMRNAFSNCK